jgi:putative ABC transport system substrate-binding protein
MIRRREFIAGLGGAAVLPLAAHAQQGDRMRRIGVLMPYGENDLEAQALVAALTQGLRDLGWTEGRNLRIEFRGIAGGGIDRIRAVVAEVVASNPDVVHANVTPIVQELQRQTRSIPIVFADITDPVETGVVASLARPGGNATGFMNYEPALSGKLLELLKEIAPGVNRVLVLVNAGSDANLIQLRAAEAAAASLGVQVSSRSVRDASEIESAIEAIGRTPNAGLFITGGIPINDRRKLIFALASRYRLPAVGMFRFFTVDGGLLSYGSDPRDMYRRSATYVDRILKGEKPGDLPVQAPIKYELIINLNAAKAIGLTLEHAAGVDADLAIPVRPACSVAHQRAGFDRLAPRIARRHPIVRGQRGELGTTIEEELAGKDKECVGPLLRKACKGCLEFAIGAGEKDFDLQSNG